MQTDLFGHSEPTKLELSIEKAKKVCGLEIHPNFIDQNTEKFVIKQIDNSQQYYQ